MHGRVQTVLGLVEPESLGVTLSHEHLILDGRKLFQEPEEISQKKLAYEPISLENLGWVRYNWTSHLHNRALLDEDVAIKEAGTHRRAGGKTIVEVTSVGLGRDPVALARISRATGLNIIMGSGYYLAITHPVDMDGKTEEQIAEEIVNDIVNGVNGTGIKAGLIGEIGCSCPWTENERKSVRAAAIAQKRTGAPLMIHPGRDKTAPLEIVAVLKEIGADLTRTIMCHIDRTLFDWENLLAFAETGCCLEYDIFGNESSYYPLDNIAMPNDAQRMDWIARLISEGFGGQVLISHDICTKHRLTCYGGHGYHHIVENIVPRMANHGISDADTNTILIENPKRLFTFA
jgi:phosphotriesterase-related protein